MPPMVVLRRLDCMLEDSADRVHAEYNRLTAAGTNEKALEKLLARIADPDRKQPLYNTSKNIPSPARPPAPRTSRRTSSPISTGLPSCEVG